MQTVFTLWPDKKWSKRKLLKNPSIMPKFIFNNIFFNKYDNPDTDTDMYYLAQNPNITEKDINDHPELAWYPPPCIDIKYFLKDPKWFIYNLSDTKNITLKDVLEYPMELENDFGWDFGILSYNANIKMLDVLENLYLHWDYFFLSLNPNLTIDFVIDYHDKEEFSYYSLIRNPNITIEDILNTPYLSWNYADITANPNITMTKFRDIIDSCYRHCDPDFSCSCRSTQWNFRELSANPAITMKDVLDNPDICWSFPDLASNPSITMDDIANNAIDIWSYKHLSLNPNITLSFIHKYIDKLDFVNLSCNIGTGILKEIKEIKTVINKINVCDDIQKILLDYLFVE